MTVNIINVFEIIQINNHECTGRILHCFFNELASQLLCRRLVVQTGQSIIERLLNQHIDISFLLIDIRYYSDRPLPAGLSCILQSYSDSAPKIMPVIPGDSYLHLFYRNIHLHIPGRIHQQMYIIRVYMAEGGHGADILRHGRITEGFHPVVRKEYPVIRQIPLKNNIIGLLHYNPVLFQTQVQFLKNLPVLCDICQNTVEYFLSIPLHQLSVIQHRYQPSVPASDSVLYLLCLSLCHLNLYRIPGAFQIFRVNQAPELIMEYLFHLFPAISEHI